MLLRDGVSHDTMNIRIITISDFDKVYGLWKQVGLWVRPFEQEKIRFDEMLKLNSDLCIVLEENGELVGTILGSYDGRAVSVHRLAVKTDQQKKGYGKLLLDTLEKKTKELGIQRIFLQVHTSNQNLLGFYRKLGYVPDPLITLTKDIV